MPTIQPNDHWHLDKKVPISIIVALLMQASAGVWWVSEIKRDVEILKAATSTQHDRDERQDRAVAEAFSQLRDAQRETNAKLDRLIERQSSGK